MSSVLITIMRVTSQAGGILDGSLLQFMGSQDKGWSRSSHWIPRDIPRTVGLCVVPSTEIEQ